VVHEEREPMSTHATGSNNPIDAAAQTETIETVKIDGTEYVKKVDHDEVIADIRAETEEHSAKIERLTEIFNLDLDTEEKQNLEEFRVEDQPVGKLLSNLLADVSDLKEYRADNEVDKAAIRRKITADSGASDADRGDATAETTIHRRETPLERLLDDPSSSAVRITKSVGRALTIAGNFTHWGKKIQDKYIINEGLKNLLSAGEHERLAWKQVHRAAHKLEELTNGKIEFKNTKRQGRILVIEDLDWFAHAISRRQRDEGVR
jgi:hypothetical protein